MNYLTLFVVVLACIVATNAVALQSSAEVTTIEIPMNLPNLRVDNFKWKNCGSADDPVKLLTLTLGPDPLVLGKNITIGFSATIGVNVTKPSAKVEIWKKEGIWIKIPCLEGLGSCDYSDLCTKLTKPCGPVMKKYHNHCQCPFPKGKYHIPKSSVPTKNPGISWLANGDYSAQGSIYDTRGKRLACYLVYVTLSETFE